MHPGALRFPRLVRVRFNKMPEAADSVYRAGMLAGGGRWCAALGGVLVVCGVINILF